MNGPLAYVRCRAIVNRGQCKIQWFEYSVVFGQFVLLVLLTLLSDKNENLTFQSRNYRVLKKEVF